MRIRRATIEDCHSIAELALIAGEGIPAYFWKQAGKNDPDILAVGAQNAASATENFSYKNVHLAIEEDQTAGMLLAYRLPDATHADSPEDFPEFIRPMIELEQQVPDSFYINMLATYPRYRNMGFGKKLMSIVDELASEVNCSTISLEVFEQNEGALGLYQRIGYEIIDSREVIPHPYIPHTGRILLLTKSVIL